MAEVSTLQKEEVDNLCVLDWKERWRGNTRGIMIPRFLGRDSVYKNTWGTVRFSSWWYISSHYGTGMRDRQGQKWVWIDGSGRLNPSPSDLLHHAEGIQNTSHGHEWLWKHLHHNEGQKGRRSRETTNTRTLHQMVLQPGFGVKPCFQRTQWEKPSCLVCDRRACQNLHKPGLCRRVCSQGQTEPAEKTTMSLKRPSLAATVRLSTNSLKLGGTKEERRSNKPREQLTQRMLS